MPVKTKQTRRIKRFKPKTFKPKKGYKTLVNKSLNPIPQRYIAKMKYCDSLQMPGVSLGVNTYRFNLNSIYDPNRTGLGHQPYGHDQLEALYNRYRVIGCSYTISCLSTSSVINVACIPSNEEKSVTTVSEAKENPRCRFITQNPGGTVKTLKGYVSLPSLTGRTKSQYMADDRYQAQYGYSPAELGILNIYAQAMDGASSETNPILTVTLEYLVESFDVKPLGQS